MSLFEGMERSEGMIKAVSAAPEKYLIDFFFFAEVLAAKSFDSQTLSIPISACFFLFFFSRVRAGTV